MKISINISHLFSMIAIIVADVYLGFEYKGNVILIVISPLKFHHLPRGVVGCY